MNSSIMIPGFLRVIPGDHEDSCSPFLLSVNRKSVSDLIVDGEKLVASSVRTTLDLIANQIVPTTSIVFTITILLPSECINLTILSPFFPAKITITMIMQAVITVRDCGCFEESIRMSSSLIPTHQLSFCCLISFVCILLHHNNTSHDHRDLMIT